MRSLRLSLPLLALLASPLASADEAKAKASAKVKAPSFSLPSFGELPKAEGISEKKTRTETPSIRRAESAPVYEVMEVKHAAGFTPGATGPEPIGNLLEALDVRGKPYETERFSTVLTIRSAQRVGAPIDVAILDTRGDTVMSATGEFTFADTKADTARYQIDWDKSPVRGPGAYQVLVRIAGTPMGTWPLKVRVDPARGR